MQRKHPKLYFRGERRPKVFPITKFGMGTKNPAVCLMHRGYGSQRNGTYVVTNTQANVVQANPSRESGGKQPYQQNRIYDSKGVSVALDGKAGVWQVKDNIMIRRLTPIECERLQGFPDNWTQGVSDTQRYKMMGNAVTVNVVEHIIKSLSNIP